MTVGLLAQAKPNFSGKWAIDAEKTTAANPAPAGGGGGAAGGGGGARGGGGGGRAGGGGGTFELKQDATSLTRITEGQNGPMETKYVLDGQAHDVTMGQGTAKVTAKIDGATIVIETTRDMGGTPVTSKAVYSTEGDWLVIATTAAPRGGGDPVTTKVYYKKG
jgi:hypothetical protein